MKKPELLLKDSGFLRLFVDGGVDGLVANKCHVTIFSRDDLQSRVNGVDCGVKFIKRIGCDVETAEHRRIRAGVLDNVPGMPAADKGQHLLHPKHLIQTADFGDDAIF